MLLLTAAVASPNFAQAAEKGVVVDLTWGVDQATQDRTAQAIADTGAQWVRMNVGWRWTETAKGEYDQAMLDKVDRAVALSRGAGARVVMLVDQTPQWASGKPDVRFPPSDPADLADFYGFLVARYGAQVDAWEVWNEPNHPNYWQPDPTKNPNACGDYLQLLRAVAPVIRAGDATAPVLFGGLAWNDYPYLERCYAIDADMGDHFDAMNTHPYAMGGAAPETLRDESPADGRLDYQTFLAYREVRRTMADHGDVKPVWLTEFGWSTATDGHPLGNVTPETQADYLTRAYRVLEQDAYVPVATWYNLRNTYTGNDGPGWLDQLGLMKTDFSPKPSYFAFKAYAPPRPPAPPAAPGEEVPPATQTPPPAEDPRPGEPVAPRPGQSPTSLRLRVRRGAARGRLQRVRLYGSARGTRTGVARLYVETRHRGRWRRLRRTVTAIRPTGAYGRTLRLPRGRRYRAYAVFPGSPALAPSVSRYARFRTSAARR